MRTTFDIEGKTPVVLFLVNFKWFWIWCMSSFCKYGDQRIEYLLPWAPTHTLQKSDVKYMWQTILSLNVPNFYQMPIFSILDHSGKVVFCTWSAVNNRDRTVNLELPFQGGNTDGNICCKANIGTVPKPLVGFFIWMVPYCSTVLKICNAMPIFFFWYMQMGF